MAQPDSRQEKNKKNELKHFSSLNSCLIFTLTFNVGIAGDKHKNRLLKEFKSIPDSNRSQPNKLFAVTFTSHLFPQRKSALNSDMTIDNNFFKFRAISCQSVYLNLSV